MVHKVYRVLIRHGYTLYSHERMKHRPVEPSVIALAIALLMPVWMGIETAHAANIYVTKSGHPAPTGAQVEPFHMVEAGIAAAESTPGSTVLIEGGKYYETFTANTPCTLQTTGGTVTIGKMDYEDSTTFEIVTLNTHLAGDEIFMPSWRDCERTDDIADFFGKTNLWPDVVGFQEIWDEHFFLYGDDCDSERTTGGIWPPLKPWYPYGRHGRREGPVLNSGLALMSEYPLTGFQQVEYEEEAGVWEPGAAKGWVQATIVKEEFSIGLFNTHTQADYRRSDREARLAQIAQLAGAIIDYRVSHPSHVVFAMGDFNVYGEGKGNTQHDEYNGYLIPFLGLMAGGMDADRNSAGFVIGNSAQWTYSDANKLKRYFDEEAAGGRLDYIFYFPSWDRVDNVVDILPMEVHVHSFRGRDLTEDGLATNESSDHWSVYGKFRLIRK